jgi:multicomponent Na+:H+ antiporter subunit D
MLATAGMLACSVALLDPRAHTRHPDRRCTWAGGRPRSASRSSSTGSRRLMVLLRRSSGSAVASSRCFGTDGRSAARPLPSHARPARGGLGAFLTGDLFNLYVWFELMLLSSFVLLTLGGERPQLEGAIKYVTLNLLSSMLFLASVGLIYAITGTLNMADLAVRLDAMDDPKRATGARGAAARCVRGSRPRSSPSSSGCPPPTTPRRRSSRALFAGLLTKVGVYALIRACTLLFDQERAMLGRRVLLFAGLTMVTGVLGAIAQNDMRRILSFHIVSQIGYMLMGLGIALSGAARGAPTPKSRPRARRRGLLHRAPHHRQDQPLPRRWRVVPRVRARPNSRLDGVVTTPRLLAALFLVSALSLAGIPVLSGFWAKLALVRGGLEAGAYVIVGVSLAVSLLTLFSMMKIWTQGFWGEASPLSDRPLSRARARGMLVPIATLTLITIAIGLGARPVYDFAHATAAQLLDPDAYIRSVLGMGEAIAP